MLRSAKQDLRTHIRNVLASLPQTIIQSESEILAQKLYARSEYVQASSVSVYLSMEKEVQTDAIVNQLFHDGKRVFIPRCSRVDMEMVELATLEDYRALPRNKWNIPEPLVGDGRPIAFGPDESKGFDLLIMPGSYLYRWGSGLMGVECRPGV
eukprot:Partr_v1_DN26781_c0_g1_i6_m8657 putative 5-formyltetrahydrofolate cycloligase